VEAWVFEDSAAALGRLSPALLYAIAWLLFEVKDVLSHGMGLEPILRVCFG
jgi:hypothetical protein